jgi:hypothetical protein
MTSDGRTRNDKRPSNKKAKTIGNNGRITLKTFRITPPS